MPNKIDLTNQIFGEWTVLREASKEEKKNKPGAYWLCKCSCGTQKIINGQCLRKQQSRSCGCQTANFIKQANHKKVIDITGAKYGKLKVLERDLEYEKKFLDHRGQTYWKCLCDCGNIKTVGKNDLIQGKIKSCGCLRKKISANNLSNISKNHFIDETGKKYGKLLVLYKVPNNHPTRQGAVWHCKCECGNEKDVFGADLRQGTVSSCGCIGTSKGEWKIAQLLNQNNITFIKQYPIQFPDRTLRFDFAILKQNKIKNFIEYDGEQHFKNNSFFGGEKYFQKLQENDKLKNQYCKQHHIPLIRIPYTKYDNITIKDLLI